MWVVVRGCVRLYVAVGGCGWLCVVVGGCGSLRVCGWVYVDLCTSAWESMEEGDWQIGGRWTFICNKMGVLKMQILSHKW